MSNQKKESNNNQKQSELALQQWATLEQASFSLEGHLIGAYGIFISFLMGAIVLLSNSDVSKHPGFYRYLFIVVSIASNFFYIMASYLGFAKARICGYTRLVLEPIVNSGFNSLLTWESFKRPNAKKGGRMILKVFMRHGHSLFVVYICIASAFASLIGIVKFASITTEKDCWDVTSIVFISLAIGGFIYANCYYLCALFTVLLNVFKKPEEAKKKLLDNI